MLYSRTFIKRLFSKIPIFCYSYALFETPIQRPALLGGSGHLYAFARLWFIYYYYFLLLLSQLIIVSSEKETGKWQCEQQPRRAHVCGRSTLTVWPVSRLPGPCPIYLKGKWAFLFVTTPCLTTTNSSECANRGHLMFWMMIFEFYTFSCVHVQHFSSTILLDIESKNHVDCHIYQIYIVLL